MLRCLIEYVNIFSVQCFSPSGCWATITDFRSTQIDLLKVLKNKTQWKIN